MDAQTVQRNVAAIAEGFARDRRARQMRRHLDPTDFDALADAGYLLTGVPAGMGGLWVDLATSTRPICEILRTLAQGDPSVALVSAMHPAVHRPTGWPTPAALGAGGAEALGRPDGAGRPLVGHHHLRARQRWRRHALAGHRQARRRRRLHAQRPEALRQRLRHHLLHDDHGGPRRRRRRLAVLPRRARRALGRLHRHEARRGVGRPRHDRHPEPRLRVHRLPGPPRGRAGNTGGGFGAVSALCAPLFTAVIVGVVQSAVAAARAQVAAAQRRACAPTSRSSGPASSRTPG